MEHPLLVEVYKELNRLLSTDSPTLGRIIGHFLQTKGKGTRPLLVLWCGEIVSAPTKRSVDLAVAVELLHMASLIHDDIVDRTDVRRQKPTIRRLWGEGAAVLAGDYFFGKMLGVISAYPDVVPHFANVVQSLVTGEFLQMDQQYDPWVPEQEYLNRIYHKTANLIATCCKINCLPNKTSFKISESLTRYGYCLGMAYQLADDLLDIAGNPDEIGKPVMQDASSGYYSLPYLHAFRNRASRLSRTAEKNFDIPTDSLEYTRKLAAQYIQKSVSSLSLLPPSKAKDGLIRISLQLQNCIDRLQEVELNAPSFD